MSRHALSRPTRHVGQYMESGDWSDYWRTAVSQAKEGRILIRGYPVDEIIERMTATEAQWLLLKGELPTSQQAQIFDVLLRVGLDQQFINSAACAGRYVASASMSPVNAVAAGILATGPVTGSPRPAMEMLYDARQTMESEALDRDGAARRVVADYRQRREHVPGFGHPMHRGGIEPRAECLQRAVRAAGGWGEHARLFEAIHVELERVLGRTVTANLAGMLAAIYCDLDFDPLLVEALAAIGYAQAVAVHAVEEIHDGVPLRIIPDALGAKYVGPPERHIPENWREQQA